MSLTNTALKIEMSSQAGRGERLLDQWKGSRPQLAAGLGYAFAHDELTERERAVAVETFKCLVLDAEVEVRRTLAEQIKSNPLLPRKLALELAEDVASVAVPILQSSPVLTDQDLVSIISSGNSVKWLAIAGRRVLSKTVSRALVDTGEKNVVEVLLANDGAAISEDTYCSLLDTFAQDGTIQELLVERPLLPFTVKERLVCLVSKALQSRMIERHGLPAKIVEQLGLQGREQSLLHGLSALRGSKEVEAAVERLAEKEALTPTLLLRALSAGLLEFFGASMVHLAQVPNAEARNALRRAGTPALDSLYRRAQLPAHLRPAFEIVLGLVLEYRRTGHTGTHPEVRHSITKEIAKSYRQISPDSLDSVIFQLSQLNADNPDALCI